MATEHPRHTIRMAMEARGYSGNRLATHAGLSHSYISRVLSGHFPLSTRAAFAICAVLGLDPVAMLHQQLDQDINTYRESAMPGALVNKEA